MSMYQTAHNVDWCPRTRRWVEIAPAPGEPAAVAIVRARRIRRVWAELTRVQRAGEPMPSMRALAARCGLPSSSTAQSCIEALVRMGAADVLARAEEPNAAGIRQRVAGALRVVKPYGWEVYE